MDVKVIVTLTILSTSNLIRKSDTTSRLLSCRAQQFLRVGSNGTVDCTVHNGFQEVSWYHSNNSSHIHHLVLKYKDSVATGEGVTSGKFGIHENGSLIIRNVSLEDQHEFTVIAKFESGQISQEVNVVAIDVNDTMKYDDVTTWRQRTSQSTAGDYTSLPKRQSEKELTTKPGSPPEDGKTEIITELVTETTTISFTSMDGSTATSHAGGMSSDKMSPSSMSLHPDTTISVDYASTARTSPRIRTDFDVLSTHLIESSDDPAFIDLTTERKLGIPSNVTQPGENMTAFSVTPEGFIKDEAEDKIRILPILIISLSSFFVTCVYISICVKLVRRKRKKDRLKKAASEEGLQLLAMNGTGLKDQFLRELKTTYSVLWEDLHSMAYVRDHVDSTCYAESGIERLSSLEDIESAGWEGVTSYHEIFDASSGGNKTFLEGDSGYGKTTLALQAANDWLTKNPNSPLKDVEILIMLRMGLFCKNVSFFEAIRSLLLSGNTSLNTHDIENILTSSSSLVIILDGFHEVYHQDIDAHSDFLRIISKQMLPESYVVTSLTSSCNILKENILSSSVYRLTGLTDSGKATYLSKSVIGRNDKNLEVRRIIDSINSNAILRELCRNPFFFSLVSHLINNSVVEVEQFSSLTKCFDVILSRVTINQVGELGLFHDDESSFNRSCERENLDTFAFKSLLSKDRKIWKKEIFYDLVGEELCDVCLRCGVLVERELLEADSRARSETSKEDSKHKMKHVRFYNNAFFEWFAAHCLARLLTDGKNAEKILNEVVKMKPNYVLRFASGISKTAAERIINYSRENNINESDIQFYVLERDSINGENTPRS